MAFLSVPSGPGSAMIRGSAALGSGSVRPPTLGIRKVSHRAGFSAVTRSAAASPNASAIRGTNRRAKIIHARIAPVRPKPRCAGDVPAQQNASGAGPGGDHLAEALEDRRIRRLPVTSRSVISEVRTPAGQLGVQAGIEIPIHMSQHDGALAELRLARAGRALREKRSRVRGAPSPGPRSRRCARATAASTRRSNGGIDQYCAPAFSTPARTASAPSARSDSANPSTTSPTKVAASASSVSSRSGVSPRRSAGRGGRP